MMNNNMLLNDLSINDVPEDFKIVIELCGIDTAKNLINNLGGLRLSIPSTKRLIPLRNKYILDNYPRLSIRRLALNLNLSERLIREIIEKNKSQRNDKIELFPN